MGDISSRLKKVREYLGKTQKDMSVLLDLSQNGWQVYEHGTNVPGGKVLEMLCRQGFDVNWILTGEGSMRRMDLGNYQLATGNGIIQAKGSISGNINQNTRHTDPEDQELIGLLEHYGTRSVKEELKARLLRIKAAVEG